MTDQDPTEQTIADDVTQVVMTPASVEPVTPPEGPPKRSRGRWALALGGAVAVVAITAALVFALVGKSPNATVLAYVPSDSIVYGELRMDLPGDQGKQIAAFLSKFPGFADQAAFEAKIDEALDRIIADGTNDKQTYTKDIKPWFEGELAFAIGPLPDASTLFKDGGPSPEIRALVLLSLKDGVLAQAWFDDLIKEGGAQVSTESYGGTTITKAANSGSGSTQAYGMAIIDGKVAVLGDVESIKAAIDTKGGGAFAAEPGPKAALGAADSDHLGFAYVALRPIVDWSIDYQKAMSDAYGDLGGMVMTPLSDSLMDALPEWEALWIRAEADAMVFEAVLPKTEAMATGESRASEAVKHVPSSTVAMIAATDLGDGVLKAWDLYKKEPSMAELVKQVEAAVELAGGVDAIAGWMGDTAFIVDRTETSAAGGVVIVPTDADDARQILTSLKAVIGQAGAAQGVTIREEDHNGTTIVIVDAGDITALAGQGGMTIPPGFDLPSGHVEAAWAVTDSLVVIGSGPDFVKKVLDTTESSSLAGDADYKALVARGEAGGAFYLDLEAIREMSEGLAADLGTDLSTYERDIQPYLTPFDAFYVSAGVDGSLIRESFIVTVK